MDWILRVHDWLVDVLYPCSISDILTVTCYLGLTSFLILRMWFGKAVQDFNYVIMGLGAQGPQLIADYGNAFTSESLIPV